MSPSRRPNRSDVAGTSLIVTAAPLAPSLQGIAVPGSRAPEVIQPDGTSGELAISPIDPTKVTGAPEERLEAFEAALDRADVTAGAGIRRVKARYIIETGTALRAIREQELPAAIGLTWTQYVTDRRKMSLSRAYQYIEAAPALLSVWTSKILEAPPNESQALVLAPIIESHGREAAEETVRLAKAEAGKHTAASLAAAAKKLGYAAPPRPIPTDQEQQKTPEDEDGDQVAQDPAVKSLRVALKQLRDIHRSLTPATVRRALEAAPGDADDLLEAMQASSKAIAKRLQYRPKQEVKP